MFRITVGIDLDQYPKALSVLRQLKPAQAEYELVHVVESVLPDKSFPDLSPDHPVGMVLAERYHQGQSELARAASKLGTDVTSRQHIVKGDPATQLIEMSSDFGSDLIAIAAGKRSFWSSLFFGSVAKGLASYAEQSILVVKEPVEAVEGLRAVFAVDGSLYGEQCIDQFLSWNLTGIKQVKLVRSVPMVTEATTISVDDLARLNDDHHREAQEALDATAQRFAAAGYEVSTEVATDHINELIERAMGSADLVVLGARGHKLLDRITLGSVSHFQVVGTCHNVLVVRVK
jgi:nucleotide-binding universal stress UspA family protein